MRDDKPRGPGGDLDPRIILRRFLAINEARLKRTREVLRPRQRDFLSLLPLLFDANHPMLPGYVNRDTPAGIAGYRPDRGILEQARRHAKSFDYRRQAGGPPALLGIYFIGSPGSIAYTAGSDFDIWLCHDPQLAPNQRDLLLAKARKIEEWAATLELEVHFFLLDVERFRRDEPMELTSESSGTAQHRLLLEEFYRTGVLVAGRTPLWWMVPPEHDGDYDAYVAELKAKRFPHIDECIDFGGLGHVPAEEFFGAAVWQLSKGIESPYKSVLKLLIIEAYASEYPDSDLLCMRFKRQVWAGEEGLERFDPYLMLLAKVESYLGGRGDEQRLELARRCFYIKVDEPLSETVRGPQEWRRLVIAATVDAWGWGAGDFLLMDRRDEWSIPRVAEERRILFDALTESYRFLSDFARRYAGEMRISQRDLTILGRKLYAAYERKAGKVDLLNRGIRRDLGEEQFSLHEVRVRGGGSGWLLFQGVVPPDAIARETPVKRSRSLVELAAWAHFNKILHKNSGVALHQRESDFNAADLGILLEQVRTHFPLDLLDAGDIDVYERPATVLRAGLYVNMGIAGRERTTLIKDSGTAGSLDALSHGFGRDNLALTVDDVVVTSWHEVHSRRYAGGEGLMDCLCDYLHWWPPGGGAQPEPIRAFGLGSNRGMSIARRVEELCADVIACFYDGRQPSSVRYVARVGSGFFVLQIRDGTVHSRALADERALLNYLGRPQAEFSPIVVDRYTFADPTLPAICRHNKAGPVQFYFRPLREEVEIHVLDERGSLFVQRLPFYSAGVLLNQYSQFFESVLNRMNLLMQDGDTLTPPAGVEFYALGRSADGQVRLERRSPEFGQHNRAYMSLQVLVDADAQGHTVFTLYCDDREFSNLEYGNRLFSEVVRYVLSRRESPTPYPIYITDISLSRQVLGEGGVRKVQTSHFLKYKQRIEAQLNRAMAALGGS